MMGLLSKYLYPVNGIVLSYLPLIERNDIIVSLEEHHEYSVGVFGEKGYSTLKRVMDAFCTSLLTGGRAVDYRWALFRDEPTDFDVIVCPQWTYGDEERDPDEKVEELKNVVKNARRHIHDYLARYLPGAKLLGYAYDDDSDEMVRGYTGDFGLIKLELDGIKFDLLTCKDPRECVKNFDLNVCQTIIGFEIGHMVLYPFEVESEYLSITKTFAATVWEFIHLQRGSMGTEKEDIQRTLARILKYRARGFGVHQNTHTFLCQYLGWDYRSESTSFD
jgi:hypothetical protein